MLFQERARLHGRKVRRYCFVFVCHLILRSAEDFVRYLILKAVEKFVLHLILSVDEEFVWRFVWHFLQGSVVDDF